MKPNQKRVEEIIERAEELRGYRPPWLRFMGEVDPEYLESYCQLYETLHGRETRLSPKFKELVTVAALAVEREDYGLNDHLRRALRLGATKEEVVETLQVAAFHTGALTLVHGLKVLIEILAEDEQAKGKGAGVVRS